MSSAKWRHLRSKLQRARGTRETRPRLLICFEDAKAAPRYFDALRVHLRLTRESFLVDYDSSVTDPHSVVQRAIARRDDLRQSGEITVEDGDQVWAVVDVDRHERIRDAQQLADSNNVNLAISNPCFEYWLLLHFEESAPSVMSCDDLISTHLKRHVPNYHKGTMDFKPIVGLADSAAQRARRQFQAKAESDPVKCCPCTLVFLLVDSLPGKETVSVR